MRMTLLMIGLAVLVVLLLYLWWRRTARTTSRFTLVDDGEAGGKLQEVDPGRLSARRGQSVRWAVGNETDKLITVTMTDFRNAETGEASRVFGGGTSGRISPGGGTIEATVLADADPGRHYYVIELVPGRPHNTPEIMIRE